MNRKDILDNPIFIFLLFIGISLVNILTSVHFIPIMFVGILFIAFIKTLENRYYYSLFWIILALLIIENIQGFRAFSLVSASLFIYIFIKPNIEHIFSSTDNLKTLYVLILYICIILIYSFFNGFDLYLLPVVVMNLIFDIIIVGLFI